MGTGLPKISVLTRCFAKGIDLFVMLLLGVALPHPAGLFLGLIYTLVHDGLPQLQGRSLGKRVFGLKVVSVRTGESCSIRESALRNAPLGVAVFFGLIPFWGWVILVLLGIPLVLLEIYLMRKLENGSRLGDVMADTHVVEYK